MARTTGLKAIAYELGISVNSVSRALRDCPDISNHTKELVRKKALELGYVQSTVANFIKKDDAKTIAVIINNFENLYFSVCLRILSSKIRDKGFEISVLCILKNKVDDEVIKQCLSQRIDGIISLVTFEEKAIDCCKLNNIPVCLMGIGAEKDEYCDVVDSDHESGSSYAANYLYNYHKFRKFVFVDNPKAKNTEDKYQLFEKALKKLSTNVEIVRILPEDLYTKALKLLDNDYFGFFCYNDEIAYECLYILNKSFPNFRKNYPRFHIVGVDALSTRIHGMTDISSVDLNLEEIADQAIELIIQRFENVNRKSKHIIMPIKFHQRVLF